MVIQLKGHPTFVSDAMAKDMMAMIDLLADLDAAEYPRYVEVDGGQSKLGDFLARVHRIGSSVLGRVRRRVSPRES